MSEVHTIRSGQLLAEHYRSAVEARDVDRLAELYHPDVLLDAHVPDWRFQLQGPPAVAEATGTGLPGPGRFVAFDVETTAAADLLLRFEWRQDTDHGGRVSREMHLLHLDDAGRIVEQVVFCAGIWDRELQARMADEAPLIRP